MVCLFLGLDVDFGFDFWFEMLIWTLIQNVMFGFGTKGSDLFDFDFAFLSLVPISISILMLTWGVDVVFGC